MPGGPSKDLCKPCEQDSDCTENTLCSVLGLRPDSPLDRYCVPKLQPDFSCLRSSEALDYPQQVGMPGIDTLHFLLPSHKDDYFTCASDCFKPQDTDGRYYPVSLFMKKPPQGALKTQADLFGLTAQGTNCLCLAMTDAPIINEDLLPNTRKGDWGNCAAALGDTETLALTVNMSQGPWNRSQFHSPDYLKQLCDPPDAFNTGPNADLCVGFTKATGEPPFMFQDPKGYWWQGTWCLSQREPQYNKICSNGAIALARSDEHAIFLQYYTCPEGLLPYPDNCCWGGTCDFSDYSKIFEGDLDLMAAWQARASQESFAVTYQTLCARPYAGGFKDLVEVR